jgi:hypothetical protein
MIAVPPVPDQLAPDPARVVALPIGNVIQIGQLAIKINTAGLVLI